jgi:hypothetical protein
MRAIGSKQKSVTVGLSSYRVIEQSSHRVVAAKICRPALAAWSARRIIKSSDH